MDTHTVGSMVVATLAFTTLESSLNPAAGEQPHKLLESSVNPAAGEQPHLLLESSVNPAVGEQPHQLRPSQLLRMAGSVPTGMRRGRADPGMGLHASEYGVQYVERKGAEPQMPCGTRFNDIDPMRWLGIGPQVYVHPRV